MKHSILAFVLLALTATSARAQTPYGQYGAGYNQMGQALQTLNAQWGQPTVTQFRYAPGNPQGYEAEQAARAQYMQTLRENQSGNSNPYGYNTNFGNRCHPVPYYNAAGQWVANMRVCN